MCLLAATSTTSDGRVYVVRGRRVCMRASPKAVTDRPTGGKRASGRPAVGGGREARRHSGFGGFGRGFGRVGRVAGSRGVVDARPGRDPRVSPVGTRTHYCPTRLPLLPPSTKTSTTQPPPQLSTNYFSPDSRIARLELWIGSDVDPIESDREEIDNCCLPSSWTCRRSACDIDRAGRAGAEPRVCTRTASGQSRAYAYELSAAAEESARIHADDETRSALGRHGGVRASCECALREAATDPAAPGPDAAQQRESGG